MNVIGYARLSQDRETSTSIATQRKVIAGYASSHGLNLVEIIEDVDVSASRTRLDQRPGMNRARVKVAMGEAEALLVYRLDRLARNVSDYAQLLRDGVQVISATEMFDTTSPIGNTVVKMLLVFAEMEAETVGLRVKASSARRLEQGRAVARPGYGYRSAPHPSGVGRARVPDEAEVAVIRRVVDELFAGRTMYSIAMGLNRDGVPTRLMTKRDPRTGEVTRRYWTPTTLRTILRRGTLMGWVTKRVGGNEVDVERDADGSPKQFWEPILTPEEYARVLELTDPKPARHPDHGKWVSEGRATRPVSLLSGLIVCAGCGRPLNYVPFRHATTEGLRPQYGCRSRVHGFACPGPVAIDAAFVEAGVEQRALEVVGDRLVRSVHDDPEFVKMTAVIENLSRRLQNRVADPSDQILQLTRLQAERQRQLKATSRQTTTQVVFRDAWARYDEVGRQSLLEQVGALVTIRRAGGWWKGRSFERVTVTFDNAR